jgi:hypothetical protein
MLDVILSDLRQEALNALTWLHEGVQAAIEAGIENEDTQLADTLHRLIQLTDERKESR